MHSITDPVSAFDRAPKECGEDRVHAVTGEQRARRSAHCRVRRSHVLLLTRCADVVRRIICGCRRRELSLFAVHLLLVVAQSAGNTHDTLVISSHPLHTLQQISLYLIVLTGSAHCTPDSYISYPALAISRIKLHTSTSNNTHEEHY